MKNNAENESLRAGREFLKQAAKWQKVVKITSDLGSEFYSHKQAQKFALRGNGTPPLPKMTLATRKVLSRDK